MHIAAPANASAEKDALGKEHLKAKEWSKIPMGQGVRCESPAVVLSSGMVGGGLYESPWRMYVCGCACVWNTHDAIHCR